MHRLIAASAALVLIGHAAAEDRPARLRLRTAPPTVRGLAPEASRPATWADSPADVVRPLTIEEARMLTPAPPSSGPILDLSRLRATLFGEVASVMQPAPVPSPTYRTEPAAPTIYARGPAYRWYGWGAMSPGRETAPAKPSESWMAQTGATPGAFPAGTATPEVAMPTPPATPEPVPTAPLAIMPVSVPMTTPPSASFDPNQPVSMTNLPQLPPGAVLVDANFQPSPPPMVGVPMTPVSPIVPASDTTSPPPMSGPPQAWKPVAPALTPSVVQASATVAVPDFTPPLERAVRDAAKGMATVTAVRFPATNRMTVALRCKNVAAANAAAKAISALPAVTPLAVEFAVELE